VAIVRTGDAVYALGNLDPFSKANVLSRGIVGDKDGIPKIASPIFKQTFDLRTGTCLDNPAVRVPTHEVRIERGRILVRREPRPGDQDGA
jgi:nitrite reductase (NADH) small subunit